MGEAERPDPHRHQAAGPVPESGSPDHRRSAAGPLHFSVGYDKVHVAVDDATRLAYAEVLTDEQKPTVIGFLSHAIAWFNGQGIECHRVMSANGLWRLQSLPCPRVEAHPHQAPHTQNHRLSREIRPPADCVYIQTLCREYSYAMAFQNYEERIRWLPRHLGS